MGNSTTDLTSPWVSRFNPSPFDSHMRILHHLSRVPVHASVLDVGCNTGELGAHIKALRDCHVVGVEREAAHLDLAAQRLDQVLISDVLELPQQLPADGQFDVVLAADVLEHLPDPWKAVRLLSGYLRGGGL